MAARARASGLASQPEAVQFSSVHLLIFGHHAKHSPRFARLRSHFRRHDPPFSCPWSALVWPGEGEGEGEG